MGTECQGVLSGPEHFPRSFNISGSQSHPALRQTAIVDRRGNELPLPVLSPVTMSGMNPREIAVLYAVDLCPGRPFAQTWIGCHQADKGFRPAMVDNATFRQELPARGCAILRHLGSCHLGGGLPVPTDFRFPVRPYCAYGPIFNSQNRGLGKPEIDFLSAVWKLSEAEAGISSERPGWHEFWMVFNNSRMENFHINATNHSAAG